MRSRSYIWRKHRFQGSPTLGGGIGQDPRYRMKTFRDTTAKLQFAHSILEKRESPRETEIEALVTVQDGSLEVDDVENS